MSVTAQLLGDWHQGFSWGLGSEHPLCGTDSQEDVFSANHIVCLTA